MVFKNMSSGTKPISADNKAISIGIFLPEPTVWFGGFNYYLRLCLLFSEYRDSKIKFIIFHTHLIDDSLIMQFKKLNCVELVAVNELKQTKIRIIRSLLIGRDPFVMGVIRKYNLNYIIESGSYYGWRLSSSVISWIPDLQHVFLKSNFSLFARLRRDFGFLIQRLTRKKIYFSSYDALKDFSKRYFIDENKLNVVRFAVNSKEVIDISSEVIFSTIKKYNLNSDYIFFPSQLWVHKNHKLLLQALGELKNQKYRSIYQFVSSGSTSDSRDEQHYDKLLALRTDIGLTDKDFIFLGQIPFSDVQALMMGSRAIINPSLFEGWSTSVEEARSINKPLILSDINIHIEQGPQNTKYFKSNDIHSLVHILSSFIENDSKDIIDTKSQVEKSASKDFQRRFYNDFLHLLLK